MIDLETNDIAYLSSKHKRDAAKTAILQTRQALERAAEEVDNYLEKFRDARFERPFRRESSGGELVHTDHIIPLVWIAANRRLDVGESRNLRGDGLAQ